MLDVILLLIVAVMLFGWLTWMSPELLRYLAARMWARAHAIEVSREQYRKMVAAIEPRSQGYTEEPVSG